MIISKKPYENGKVASNIKERVTKQYQFCPLRRCLSACILVQPEQPLVLKQAFQMDSSMVHSKLITVPDLVCLLVILFVMDGKSLFKGGIHSGGRSFQIFTLGEA